LICNAGSGLKTDEIGKVVPEHHGWKTPGQGLEFSGRYLQ
jgi:hypothetical protein